MGLSLAQAYAMQRIRQTEVTVQAFEVVEVAVNDPSRIVLMIGLCGNNANAPSFALTTDPSLSGIIFTNAMPPALMSNATHGALTQVSWYVFNGNGNPVTVDVVEVFLDKQP